MMPIAPLNAWIGFAIWLVSVALLPLRLESAILLFAPLVMVPLGLLLLPTPAAGTNAARLGRAISWLQFPAAVALVVAYALPTGILAAGFAAPWLLVTVLLAGSGVLRGRACVRSAAAMCSTAALVLPVVAAGWIVLFRLGRWPLDFTPQIVELTGVHFHYAGFVLPVLLYRAASARPGWATSTASAAALVGIPLVAIGITWSPVLEVIAATLVAGGCVLLAVVQLQIAAETNVPAARSLLAISSLSLLGGMSLAVLYALGEYLGAAWIDIATMIPTHGIANAFGFGLAGLCAWRVVDIVPCRQEAERRTVNRQLSTSK